jgi:hypothetical protein
MTEADWQKIMAERRKNLPAMRERMLTEGRDILFRITRMPANDDGTPFVTALSFNREEILEIQSVLRKWLERDSELLLEASDGR